MVITIEYDSQEDLDKYLEMVELGEAAVEFEKWLLSVELSSFDYFTAREKWSEVFESKEDN